MRVVFMGSAPIAVPTLVYLRERHQLLGVVTQPDKPFGRKRELTSTAVKTVALPWQLPIFEPRRLKAPDFVEALRALDPEVIVVMAYGRLVPTEVLYLPPHGCINLHGSILPDHRGPCPIERGILQGDPVGGITTFYMNEGFDTGDVILTREIAIAADETAGSLREKLSKLAVEAIDETLRRLVDGSAPRLPQNLQAGSHAAIITRDEARIDWTQDAAALDRLVRACEPEPGAFTLFRGQPLKIRRVGVVDAVTDRAPATVVAAERSSGLHVAAGNGTVLSLLEVQPAGKRWMGAADFLAGNRLQVGETLGQQ